MDAPTELQDSQGLGAYGEPQPLGLHRLTGWMNAAGTLLIFGLLVVTNLDILGRDLFNRPLRGTTEMMSVGIVVVVFLQLPNTLWAGRFPRADFLLEVVNRRSPRAAAAMQFLFHLVGVVMMTLLCVAIWPELIRAWELNDFFGALGDFAIPLWPVRLIMLVGCVCCALTFLFLAWADVRRALSDRLT
jgi:TRAP-type mannitol/chloroaromatic compound transport system permease small subunit